MNDRIRWWDVCWCDIGREVKLIEHCALHD